MQHNLRPGQSIELNSLDVDLRREVFSRFVTTLPFGEETEPDLGAQDVRDCLSRKDALKEIGIAAQYPDYYGLKAIQFDLHDRPIKSNGTTVRIPSAQWNNWLVVRSGSGRIYAEKIVMRQFEQGVTLFGVNALIAEHTAALNQEALPRTRAVAHLRMLGYVPVSSEAAMDAAAGLRASKSLIRVGIEDLTDGAEPFIVVHTPRMGVAGRVLPGVDLLATAQRSGLIESVRFGLKGGFVPVGATRPLRNGREAIVRVQSRLLRRVLNYGPRPRKPHSERSRPDL
jgi:hypothetical protein